MRMRRGTVWCLGGLLGIAILLRWLDEPWINPSFFQAGVFGLACLWFGRMAIGPHEGPDRVRGNFGLIPLAGAVGWGLIQLATGHTVSRWETWNAVLVWTGNLAAFFVALQIGGDVRLRQALLRWMAAFGFAIALVSVLQFFSSPGKLLWFYENGGSNFGPFRNRDLYAAFAELMLPVAVVQALREQRWRWFYAAAAATLFAGVIAGASRAGSALIVVEVVALGMLGWGRAGFRRSGPRGMVAVLAAMVCAFTAVVGVETVLKRFRDPDPYAGRREYLESAVAMTRERPGMGFGLGNFENAYPAYARIDLDKIVNHAHNDWAEWAADGGVPFLGLMVGMAAWVIPKAVRSLWGLGIVAVLAHAIVDFPLQAPAFAFWVFTLMGLLAGSDEKHRAD